MQKAPGCATGDVRRQHLQRAKQNSLLGFGVLLIILTSFCFETNGKTSGGSYDGPGTGTALACIIGTVLLFKLVRIWADILVAQGRINERPRFYFDWLILAVIFIPSVGYVARGPDIVDWAGETKPSWLFKWGMSNSLEDYGLAVIALVFVLRVYAVAKALLEATQADSP